MLFMSEEKRSKIMKLPMNKSGKAPPLHTVELMRRSYISRVLTPIYTIALFVLFYRHISSLYHSTSLLSSFITLALLIADLILAFEWSGATLLRFTRVRRKQFPENLPHYIKKEDYPAIDIVICTADPYKEPPIDVVNTALSVLAYDYPPEKLTVYLSDDGGSNLTLFAFFEAAKFAAHWLPFCNKFNLIDRNPKLFFESHYTYSPEAENIKLLYESMKGRIENIMEKGRVDDEYITNDKERRAFRKWNHNFTRQNHPSVIQVILDSKIDKDTLGHNLPNLIYVAREKSSTAHHHFKAGALNALIRVSGVMTNAPILLILDCDTYSNDPKTLERMLCYLWDPKVRAEIAYVQFTELFTGLNKNDIYAGECKREFQIFPHGFDGMRRMFIYGTNVFLSRRAFFGPPKEQLPIPEMPQLDPSRVVDKSIQSEEILELAARASGCHFEEKTNWGTQKGFRYGSLVEDTYTGYRMHLEGWRAMFCIPERPAFLADSPTSLMEVLIQQKRWAVGFLEIGFCKYSPLTYGLSRSIRNHVASQYSFCPTWCIPFAIYCFIPQLALLNNCSIFPEAKSPWFALYMFLFTSAYAVDMVDHLLHNGTISRWWNDQRMWNIKCLTSYAYALSEFTLKTLGLPTPGFTITSKVIDEEVTKRYKKGLYEFGSASLLFVPLVMAASVNLASFSWGAYRFAIGKLSIEKFAIQMLLSAFGVVNSWPIYEAMVLRSDNGRIPTKITLIGASLTWAFYVIGSSIFK